MHAKLEDILSYTIYTYIFPSWGSSSRPWKYIQMNLLITVQIQKEVYGNIL